MMRHVREKMMKKVPEMADGSECESPLMMWEKTRQKVWESVLKNVRNIRRELAMVDVINVLETSLRNIGKPRKVWKTL